MLNQINFKDRLATVAFFALVLISQLIICILGLYFYHNFIYEKPHLLSTVKNFFTSKENSPTLDKYSDYIHPTASIIGAVEIGHKVFIAPQASLRGDEGTPIHIGDETNIQDGVVIHALETEEEGHSIPSHLLEEMKTHRKYAVYVGNHVSLAHQSQVHGPAIIEDNTFVGMQSLVFNSIIDEGCVIEPGCKIINVHLKEKTFVPAGSIITTQKQADALKQITEDYALKDINKKVVAVNTQLATDYNKRLGY
jgi:carbonic anhydrase/acetyltransferase-like protein (isoleucine patch superfamily)